MAFAILEGPVDQALSERNVASPDDLRTKWRFAVAMAGVGGTGPRAVGQGGISPDRHEPFCPGRGGRARRPRADCPLSCLTAERRACPNSKMTGASGATPLSMPGCGSPAPLRSRATGRMTVAASATYSSSGSGGHEVCVRLYRRLGDRGAGQDGCRPPDHLLQTQPPAEVCSKHIETDQQVQAVAGTSQEPVQRVGCRSRAIRRGPRSPRPRRETRGV